MHPSRSTPAARPCRGPSPAPPAPPAARGARPLALLVGLTCLALGLLAACDDATVPTSSPVTANTTVPTPPSAPLPPTATARPRDPPTVPPSPTPSQAALESAYLLQATSIVSSVLTAPEISDAVTAGGEAGTTVLLGGTVNVTTLTDKLANAAAVVAAAGEQLAALNPPAAYQATHEQLLNVFAQYDTAFSQAATAVQNGDWLALATVAGDIAAATDELNTLLNQLK